MPTKEPHAQLDPHSIVEIVKDRKAFDTPEWTDMLLKMGSEYQTEFREAFPIALKRLKGNTGKADDGNSLAPRLKRDFQDKDEIIDLMFISAIAQEPMLIFGPPGSGKSDLVTRFTEGLGVRRFATQEDSSLSQSTQHYPVTGQPSRLYFEYLLNQFTEPDELLGPVEVAGLTKEPPQFRRFRDGMLVDAAIVFLDEIFRANSAILNALLSLINERRIYEAGTAIKAKLLILFGAANDPPTNDDLRAFYERFPIRVVSHPVDFKLENRLGLLEKGWKIEVGKLAAGYDPAFYKTPQLACLNDLLLCSRAAVFLWPLEDLKKDAFIQRYTELVTSLNKDSRDLCRIDDRKFIRLYKLLRAKSLYERLEPPNDTDLKLLKHTWHSRESMEPLSRLVDA